MMHVMEISFVMGFTGFHMSRNCYVYLNKKLVIFYSYKSGNTSLATWLYDQIKAPRDNGKAIPSRRKLLRNSNTSVDIRFGYNLITEHGFTGVVLARNPYSRAISAYVNKFVLDGEKWLTGEDKMEGFARDFKTPCTGISFVEYLKTIDSATSVKGGRVDPHFNTQVPKFLAGKKYFDTILRLESIDDDLKAFCQKYELPFAPFPSERATAKSIGTPSSEDLSNCNSFDLAKAQIKITKENLLNSETKALIRKIYKTDFEVLNYPK